ncbi:alanine racemase [Mycobacterium sp. 050134]|uniref:spermine/spermidine synthase domain-containing protein n=1 Tax=Mycobacterium sp. 050134 TaxID=3096111 RepID=UPI002ED83753
MPETPYLTIDLDRVRESFGQLRDLFPGAEIRYAVKANPAEPVLRLFAAEGATFDVASVGEIDACAAAGVEARLLTLGNPVQKASAAARAHSVGVRRFAFDTDHAAATIAEHAPGSGVECRIAPAFPSSVTPFGHKFGCAPEAAAGLLDGARRRGLRPEGVCFHVGSQQLDPSAWELGIRSAADVFATVGGLTTINVGGGFPVAYASGAPSPAAIADSIMSALARYFPGGAPRLVIEPGRVLVGPAGTIHCEVVGVRHGTDGRRWVYLDVGRYGGLAETENEYIRYRLRTSRDGDARDDAVVAGPTCDGDDVLYRNYPLPVTLRPGDRVQIADAGAYTASYASTSFNGFPPLPTTFGTAAPAAAVARVIVEPMAPGLTRTWELSEVICEADTEYQHLVIGRTAQGMALFADGERQSTELSQLVYHEALLVPALLLAARIERVLVIGSGEGVVSQLAVAAGATHVDHVDIDSEAVRLCARHLPYGYTPMELAAAERGLGPVSVHYGDGWSFVEGCGAAYDIVVVDLPDERAGPAQHNRLYEADFLERCRAIGGVVTAQAGCPTLWRNESLHGAWRRFQDVFDRVVYFGSDEHEWAFLSGISGGADDPLATMSARLRTLPYRPRAIDAESLVASTVPPKALRSG